MRAYFIFSLITVTAVTLGACVKGNECDFGACGSPTADGGGDAAVVDGGPDVVQPPAGCDAAAEPKDAPACVVDGFGVFVDATGGTDGNAGTKASPMKTITAALGKVGNKPRVYVCEGTYAEHVKLTTAVSLYGGFACGTWRYSATKAKVAPADAGYALEVSKVSSAMTVADLSFAAVAGNAAAPSSIAALVSATPTLTLRRLDLVAGAGFAAPNESKASTLALMSSTPTAGTLNGNAGGAVNGGLAQDCICVGGGTSKGGGGGNVGSDGSPGETAQVPPSPLTATGAGGTKADCAGSTGGRVGSDAPPAASAAGATTLGVLAETGWRPASGGDAAAGTPGQGGGGGGGNGGGGGSGACGGCGGEGGKGGAGGGASVALATVSSPVSLLVSTLTSSAGGAGGSGGAGGDGAAGGTRGSGGVAACNGGNGGKGGSGGGGGGGAGGVSAGVLYKGAKPTLDGSTKVTTGALGGKGVGAGLDGVDGQKADMVQAP